VQLVPTSLSEVPSWNQPPVCSQYVAGSHRENYFRRVVLATAHAARPKDDRRTDQIITDHRTETEGVPPHRLVMPMPSGHGAVGLAQCQWHDPQSRHAIATWRDLATVRCRVAVMPLPACRTAELRRTALRHERLSASGTENVQGHPSIHQLDVGRLELAGPRPAFDKVVSNALADLDVANVGSPQRGGMAIDGF
jgi:hypothetical protein